MSTPGPLMGIRCYTLCLADDGVMLEVVMVGNCQ